MEKQFINPPQLYKHPAYSRVVTVKGPCKFIQRQIAVPLVATRPFTRNWSQALDTATISND
jgi:hypothetical protein